jgi:hypothetical protein
VSVFELARIMGTSVIIPRTLNRVTEYVPSYAFSTAYADVWRPEARRLTLVRLNAVLERARANGLSLPDEPPLLVIKEVNGSHGADLVMPLFPRSRMIFVVRDGRDVLDSNSPGGWLLKRNWGRDRLGIAEGRREFVRETSLQWTARMNACRRAYEAHDSALRLEVRYEDLLADTAARLGELERWLGLPSGPKRMKSIAAKHAFDAVPEWGAGPRKLPSSGHAGRLARRSDCRGAGRSSPDHGRDPRRARLRGVKISTRGPYVECHRFLSGPATSAPHR